MVKNRIDSSRELPVYSTLFVSRPVSAPRTCHVLADPDRPSDIRMTGFGPSGSRQFGTLGEADAHRRERARRLGRG